MQPTELASSTLSTPIVLPPARVPIRIRAGTLEDVPFLDALQKKTTKQVGFMPRAQFEGKVRAGHVLVAEVADDKVTRRQGEGVKEGVSSSPCHPLTLSPCHSPVGYLIGNDQYFKRDDLGIIYQMNVLPEYRRHLVAAQLLKAQFERSAWGCRLYCCWCAQDIEANRFWAAMGFVALAFRTGSEKKSRTHIFWQKRIRAGDTSTPWWFPAQTSGGSIREDRLVLPIPPGTHWSEAKPMVLPGMTGGVTAALPGRAGFNPPELPDDATSTAIHDKGSKPVRRKPRKIEQPLIEEPKPSRVVLGGGMMFFTEPAVVDNPVVEKKPRVKKPKVKNDPAFVTAARELRDRYLDEVNAGRFAVEPDANEAKYEPARLEAESVAHHQRALSAA